MAKETKVVPRNAEAGTKPHDVMKAQKPICDETPVKNANRMTDDEALKAYASLKDKENRTSDETKRLAAALEVMQQEKVIVLDSEMAKKLRSAKKDGCEEWGSTRSGA